MKLFISQIDTNFCLLAFGMLVANAIEKPLGFEGEISREDILKYIGKDIVPDQNLMRLLAVGLTQILCNGMQKLYRIDEKTSIEIVQLIAEQLTDYIAIQNQMVEGPTRNAT